MRSSSEKLKLIFCKAIVSNDNLLINDNVFRALIEE